MAAVVCGMDYGGRFMDKNHEHSVKICGLPANALHTQD